MVAADRVKTSMPETPMCLCNDCHVLPFSVEVIELMESLHYSAKSMSGSGLPRNGRPARLEQPGRQKFRALSEMGHGGSHTPALLRG